MLALVTFASLLVTVVTYLAMFACSVTAFGLFLYGIYTAIFSNLSQGLMTLGMGVVVGLFAKLVIIIGTIISGLLATSVKKLAERELINAQEPSTEPKENQYATDDKEEDQIYKVATNLGKNQLKLGQDIADDCFINGLSAGEYVSLEDISHMIHSKFDYMPHAVENGFLHRMKEYIESGVVVNLSVKEVGTVFVHKDHVEKYFQ